MQQQRERDRPTDGAGGLTLPARAPGAGSALRPFRREDIPQVAALRRQVFQYHQRSTVPALGDYLEQIFFHNPWAGDLPSWVSEDGQGHIVGFLGVLSRPMRFQDQPIRVAVATQAMVAPQSRGLVGRRLMRAFLDGPQDLSLSDTANDAARLIWRSLGGHVSVTQSLTWLRPLRPFRYHAARWGDGPLLRAARFAARPLLKTGDLFATGMLGPFNPRRLAGALEPLNPSGLCEAFHAVCGHYPLRPAYDESTLAWLLARLAEKREFGGWERALVRDETGELAGWFVYAVRRGGVAQVAQWAARRSRAELVLRRLFGHAWRRGGIAVAGRVEPAWVEELAAQGCRFLRDGPWMLLHSARPEILLAIERGEAMLSRLEGEWWLSF